MSVKHRVGRLYKLCVGIWIQLVSHGPDPSCDDWWGGVKGRGGRKKGLVTLNKMQLHNGMEIIFVNVILHVTYLKYSS